MGIGVGRVALHRMQSRQGLGQLRSLFCLNRVLQRNRSVQCKPSDAGPAIWKIPLAGLSFDYMDLKHNTSMVHLYDESETQRLRPLLVFHTNPPRKVWKLRVRTWFDQWPGSKFAKTNSTAKVAALGVRLLRPSARASIVHSNQKLRKGLSLSRRTLAFARRARGVGTTVSHRRRNPSEEGKVLNTERLSAEGLQIQTHRFLPQGQQV